ARQGGQRRRERAGEDAAPPRDRVEDADEELESEEAVDDGRDAREVGDVDLDELRQPAWLRVFLEVDRGRDADRKRDDGGQDEEPDGADERRVEAGVLRLARWKRGQELPVEPREAGPQTVAKHGREDEQ